MNTFAKVLAPVALVFAAFGAQASELSTGDLQGQSVQRGTAPVMSVAAQAGHGGELIFGDFGTTAVVAGSTGGPVMAGRIVSNFAIGA